METERRRYRSFVADSARWDHVALREGDIIISTPAKCGTTWMQMLCALAIFRTPHLPAPLASLSPWIDMQTRPLDEVLADVEAQTHRRFFKTHTPLDGLPFDGRVTYVHVCRDPRDVALSWANHLANMDMDRFIGIRIGAVGADDLEELGVTGDEPPTAASDPADAFWQWVDTVPSGSDMSGLAGLANHAATFWARRHEPNVHLFHYGDLRRDLAGEMARLFAALGVAAPTDELVAAASFEAMRSRADELVPNSDTPFWRDQKRFFDRARSGDWRAFVDAKDEERYLKLVDDLAPPDLAAWLHTGWDAQASS